MDDDDSHYDDEDASLFTAELLEESDDGGVRDLLLRRFGSPAKESPVGYPPSSSSSADASSLTADAAPGAANSPLAPPRGTASARYLGVASAHGYDDGTPKQSAKEARFARTHFVNIHEVWYCALLLLLLQTRTPSQT